MQGSQPTHFKSSDVVVPAIQHSSNWLECFQAATYTWTVSARASLILESLKKQCLALSVSKLLLSIAVRSVLTIHLLKTSPRYSE